MWSFLSLACTHIWISLFFHLVPKFTINFQRNGENTVNLLLFTTQLEKKITSALLHLVPIHITSKNLCLNLTQLQVYLKCIGHEAQIREPNVTTDSRILDKLTIIGEVFQRFKLHTSTLIFNKLNAVLKTSPSNNNLWILTHTVCIFNCMSQEQWYAFFPWGSWNVTYSSRHKFVG